jgi:hypothetical protein
VRENHCLYRKKVSVLGSPCSSMVVAYYQKAIWLDVTWHAGPSPGMSRMLCTRARRRLHLPQTSDTSVSLLRSVDPEMFCCDADNVTSAHPPTWNLGYIATVGSVERVVRLLSASHASTWYKTDAPPLTLYWTDLARILGAM